MRFPPDLLDEIRARLPASDVVGRKVKLKKAGREWRGLSPFNAEKTPSFYVNDQKAFYHCFSSGKHGDIFTFLMEVEGLTFPEAVERLAAEAGVALPKETDRDREAEERRRSLHDVMEEAAAFFEASLEGRGGGAARDYLRRRGLEGAILKRFRIGYAGPDRFALRDHLAGKGIPAEAMLELGLLVGGENIAVPFDRFRDRVMFPIADPRGRIVAFGGRALSAEAQPKYLNSPETPLFSKGRLLYNLHHARKAGHEAGRLIVVEGYVDAIALTKAGFAEAVAPLGTALTEDQLTLLWRLTDTPVLCFDGDKAGRRAAGRALEVALPLLTPQKSLRFALLPDGRDPDDLVQAGGRDAVMKVLEAARSPLDMLWLREEEAGPLDTPERRAAFEQRVKAAVALIRDETLRRHYRDDVIARLDALRPNARGGAAGGRAARRGGGRIPPPVTSRITGRASPMLAASALFSGVVRESPREAVIVAIVLAHPELLHRHVEDLAAIELAGSDAARLRDLLIDVAARGDSVDPEAIAARVGRAGLADAASRLAAAVRPGERWVSDPHADPQRLEETLRQAVTLHRRASTLHSELKAAERALAEEENEANLAWLTEVRAQLSSLEGAEADAEDEPATRRAG